jgi:hypothetical protein
MLIKLPISFSFATKIDFWSFMIPFIFPVLIYLLFCTSYKEYNFSSKIIIKMFSDIQKNDSISIKGLTWIYWGSNFDKMKFNCYFYSSYYI